MGLFLLRPLRKAVSHHHFLPCVWLVSPHTPNPGASGGASWMLTIFALGASGGCFTGLRGNLLRYTGNQA